jgi:hypothetical protein
MNGLGSDMMGLGMPSALANLVGESIPAAVAGVGTAQSGAPSLTGTINQVTTASGQTAVVLPSTQPLGTAVHVYVSTATAALVFPPVGGAINELSANASTSVAQGRLASFVRVSATKWLKQYGA